MEPEFIDDFLCENPTGFYAKKKFAMPRKLLITLFPMPKLTINNQAFNIDWMFFLQMLSAERTICFFSELALPFKKDACPFVLKWARAHLEVYVFSTFLSLKKETFNNELDEAWQDYRKVEGIIDEKRLFVLSENYLQTRIFNELFYSEIRDLLDTDTENLLIDWFTENYLTIPALDFLWYVALRNLVAIYQQDRPPQISLPINNDLKDLITGFCRQHDSAQLSLDLQFFTLEEISKLLGPTPWERVLQNHPPGEGTLKYYPWVNTTQKCIRYRLLRSEWTGLRQALGADQMKILVDWIQQNSALLLHPWNLKLPDEPKPL